MDPNALYRTLEGTFNPAPEIRQEAEKQLKEAEAYPGYLGIIYQVACSNDVNIDVRQAAAIRLKNKLKPKDWNAEDSPVQTEEKELIKNSFLTAIVNSPAKICKILLECFRLILVYDFPERWPNIVEEIKKGLQGENFNSITGALSCLRVLCKRFEYRPEGDERKPLAPLINETFPLLIQLFSYVNNQQQLPEEGANMQKLLCKIFWSSTSMGLPKLFFNNPAHFGSWLDCFLFVLHQPVPVNDPKSPYWKVKKWVGHISHRLFQRYGDTKGNNKRERQLGSVLLQNYGAKYLDAWFKIVDLYRSKQFVSPQVLTLCLNFLDLAYEFQPTYERMYPHLDLLIQEILIPMMAFDDADAELWSENPQEYMRKLYDPFGDVYNPRFSGLNLLLKITNPTESFQAQDVLPRLLLFINNILIKYASDSQKDFRAKDGVLFVIGNIRRRLLNNKDYEGQIEPLLVTHVFPEFQSPVGFLRSKAVWVCGQYHKITWSNVSNLGLALNGVVTIMQDPELPVRVQAGMSLRNFIRHKQCQEVIQPMLEQLIGQVFNLMNEIDNDALIETLELIIEKFGDNLAGAALQLCRRLADHFIKTSPEDAIASQTFNFEDKDDDKEDEQEDQTMAAAACLRALCTLLHAIHKHEELYPQMAPIIVPLLRILFQPNKSEFIDEALELLSRYTYFSKPLTPETWSLFPLLQDAYDSYAADYLPQMLAPLDNYISRDPAVFSTGTAPNGKRYIQMVYEMMKKCLEDPDMSTDYATCPKIMDSILQHCRDYQTQINDYVPMFFDLIMAVMSKNLNMGDAFRILCMNVMACGLYYNTQFTMQYLNQRNVLVGVMNVWISVIPKLKRKYDRKISALGLLCIFAEISKSGYDWLPTSFFNMDKLKLLGGFITKLVIQCHQDSVEEDEAEKCEEEEEESSDDSDSDDDFGDSGDDDSDEEDEEEEVEEDNTEEKEKGFNFDPPEKSKEHFEKLIKETREIRFGQEMDFGVDELDEEDYESAIDEIEEAIIFRDVMAQVSNKASDLYQAMITSLTPEAKTQIDTAIKYGEEKAKKREEEKLKPK